MDGTSSLKLIPMTNCTVQIWSISSNSGLMLGCTLIVSVIDQVCWCSKWVYSGKSWWQECDDSFSGRTFILQGSTLLEGQGWTVWVEHKIPGKGAEGRGILSLMSLLVPLDVPELWSGFLRGCVHHLHPLVLIGWRRDLLLSLCQVGQGWKNIAVTPCHYHSRAQNNLSESYNDNIRDQSHTSYIHFVLCQSIEWMSVLTRVTGDQSLLPLAVG